MRILLFLILVTLPPFAQATIYRCKLPSGVSFQARPCPDEASSNEVEIEDYRIGTRAVPVTKLKKSKTQKTRRRRAKANTTGNKKACFSKKQQLEKVQWTLRRGYKASAGARLHQRRRSLEAYLREFCG
jgi:hypothetical protein